MKERVLICGDRNWGTENSATQWDDLQAMYDYIEELPAGTEVIHGAAKGADQLAGEYALAFGLTVRSFPARWELYGKAAGPIRNQQMLDEGKPTRFAFAHRNLENSKGTKNMVEKVRKQRPDLLIEEII